jgi:hypothetical protein
MGVPRRNIQGRSSVYTDKSNKNSKGYHSIFPSSVIDLHSSNLRGFTIHSHRISSGPPTHDSTSGGQDHPAAVLLNLVWTVVQPARNACRLTLFRRAPRCCQIVIDCVRFRWWICESCLLRFVHPARLLVVLHPAAAFKKQRSSRSHRYPRFAVSRLRSAGPVIAGVRSCARVNLRCMHPSCSSCGTTCPQRVPLNLVSPCSVDRAAAAASAGRIPSRHNYPTAPPVSIRVYFALLQFPSDPPRSAGSAPRRPVCCSRLMSLMSRECRVFHGRMDRVAVAGACSIVWTRSVCVCTHTHDRT